MTEPEKSGSHVEYKRTEMEPGIWIVEVEPVYQIKTVAKIMDVTAATVRLFIKRNELPAFTSRAGTRINHSDLKAFLEEYYNFQPNKQPSAGIHKAMAARGITKYKGALDNDE